MRAKRLLKRLSTESAGNYQAIAGSQFDHELQNSAHVNNSPTAYATINPGNQYVRAEEADDAWAIGQAIQLLESTPITFMLMHLQDTGRRGRWKGVG